MYICRKKGMRRSCLTILLLGIVLVSCDPGFSQEYYFQNDSSHNVTIVALMDTADMYYFTYFDSIRVRYFNNPDGIIIPAGERILLDRDGGLGRACNEGTGEHLRHYIYGDSVRFVFDDGRYLYFHHELPAPHSPYDSDSYVFEGDFRRFGSEGISTYILTDDDYARADR